MNKQNVYIYNGFSLKKEEIPVTYYNMAEVKLSCEA